MLKKLHHCYFCIFWRSSREFRQSKPPKINDIAKQEYCTIFTGEPTSIYQPTLGFTRVPHSHGRHSFENRARQWRKAKRHRVVPEGEKPALGAKALSVGHHSNIIAGLHLLKRKSMPYHPTITASSRIQSLVQSGLFLRQSGFILKLGSEFLENLGFSHVLHHLPAGRSSGSSQRLGLQAQLMPGLT